MKTKIDIDFDKLFKRSNREEGPPPELVVVGGSGKEGTSSSSSLSVASDMDVLARSSDRDISDKIDRIRGQYKSLASKLPDKGAKLLIQVEQLEEEQKRRREFGFQKKAEAWEKPMQSQKFLSSGSACNGFVPNPKSFASRFSQQLEEKPDCSTHLKATAFHSELSHLALANQQNGQADGILPNKRRWEDKISSSQSPFRCSRSFNCNDKHRMSNGAKKVIAPSNFYQPCQDENLSNILSNRRKASGVHASSNLRKKRKKNQTVVLVDEEDCQAIKTTENEDEPIRRETKFYYPSRDDPESVELCYSDMKHLAPEAFLSDSIMNFYIRYLQRPITATGKSQSDYYFFNTYFYKKLKEAVSYKGNDKDTFYSKFRRWWKGVNMFGKAYILLPIHEIQHWSLVIICMPDKEDESGPIILHLDSLGFHLSSQIFQNVKRFLTEEWSYLDKQVDSPNVPIAERIWRHLPRRIDEKAITMLEMLENNSAFYKVPQQKNDYDCGIFVLYYMERFIQEAPERLRRKDLAMFSKQWFRPEEASGLRKRIRSLLKEEFENASLENENKSREPSPDDSGDDPVDTVDVVHDKLGKNSRESSPMSSDDDLLDLTGMNKSRQSSSTYSDHYPVECDQDTYS